MTSTIKVDNIQKVSDGSNIIKKCGSTITVGSSGQTVALASGASQTGFGTPSSSVLWCTTAKTSPFTAADQKGYFVNTSGGAVTVTLPSSPSAGDVVALKDYGNTWDTNAVTLGRNGSKINGTCSCAVLDTKAQSVTLIYVDGTKGWQDVNDSTANVSGAQFVAASGGNATLTVGDFKTHIFTSSGPFNITSAGNPGGSFQVDYLVVAGGASGGASPYNGSGAGAGGAGGFRMANSLSLPAPTTSPLASPSGLSVSVSDFTITVGGGGASADAGTSPTYVSGNNGGVSTFSTITSAGGGGGSGGNSPTNPAKDGGSGGGSGYNPLPAKGVGNTPPVSPPQGNPGGNSNVAGAYAASGGGGAAAAGAGAPGCATGGVGGIGTFVGDPFFGPTAPSYGTPGPVSSTRYFAGGGGGAGGLAGYPAAPSITAGAGGAGGGGAGGGEPVPTRNGVAGTVNTGGGSGGTAGSFSPPANGVSKAGGSGFVAIRYKFQN